MLTLYIFLFTLGLKSECKQTGPGPDDYKCKCAKGWEGKNCQYGEWEKLTIYFFKQAGPSKTESESWISGLFSQIQICMLNLSCFLTES